MYISFIRPVLEYCDSIWDNAQPDSKRQLEAINVEAARTITGATKLKFVASIRFLPILAGKLCKLGKLDVININL